MLLADTNDMGTYQVHVKRLLSATASRISQYFRPLMKYFSHYVWDDRSVSRPHPFQHPVITGLALGNGL